MSIKKIIRIRGPRINMFHFLLLHDLYQFLHKRKADNTRLSITIVNCSYGKLHAQPGKTIHSDVCWWPQVSNTAGTSKACRHRSEHIVRLRVSDSLYRQQVKATAGQVFIWWLHRQTTPKYANSWVCLIKLIKIIARIRSASSWSIKLFDTEHTLRRVSIYLPKLFFLRWSMYASNI